MTDQPSFNFGPPPGSPRNPPDQLFTAIKPSGGPIAEVSGLIGRMKKDFHLTGKSQNPDVWHVSLVGLGAFDEAVAKAVLPMAASVSVPAFEIRFDRLASFSAGNGNKAVVLCGGKDENPGVRRLYAALVAALAGGASPRKAKPFVPHMTLMYDRHGMPDTPVAPIVWTVREFLLVRSHYGQSRHSCIDHWPLPEAIG